MPHSTDRRAFLAALAASSALAACGGGGNSSIPNASSSTGGTSTASPGPTPVSTTTTSPSPGATSTASATATSTADPSGASTANVVKPLVIDGTQTDLPAGTKIYAYIIGLVSSTNTFYRIDATGTPHVLSTSDNTNAAGTFPNSSTLTASAAAAIAPNYPSAWADYSIPVSQVLPTQITLANINTSTMPGLGTGTAAFSGRIYLSIGVPKLPFTAALNGYTAPVFANPPGNLTLFDWIEFSFDSTGAFNGNTTQVDQFGFKLTLNGTPGGTLQGAFNASRATLLQTISSGSTPLGASSTVAVPAGGASAYPSGTSLLRAISPKTQNGNTGAYSTYFNNAVAAANTLWSTTPLVTNDRATGYYTGYFSGGTLKFVAGNYPTLTAAAAQPTAFTIPSSGGVIPSNDIWQCAGSLATGNAAQKNVQKQIAAMFNRGNLVTVLDDTACPAPSTYYPAGSTSNTWASTFHQAATNGNAYGFPYDDVCNQNPSISLAGTTSVTITIGKFFS